MKVYTRKGDDGTTGLMYGGRVAKDSLLPTAYGAVDEAQAAIGLARAEARTTADGAELDALLVAIERDLWTVMAELATDPAHRHKLAELVDGAAVDRLEHVIDDLSARFEPPTEFVVPGSNRVSALLDVARTVTRRAERACLAAAGAGSSVVPYLNRLSDLLWTMARWQEGTSPLTKEVPR